MDKEIQDAQKDLDKAAAKIKDGGDTEKNRKEYDEVYADLEDQKNNAAEDMAIIHVYYKELGIIQYSRDELYSFTDFIGMRQGLGSGYTMYIQYI